VLDPGVSLTTLPNGARVVSEHMPEARSLALGCWVAVGNRDEPEEIAGASHFCEHLLFKGTASRSSRDIAEAIDATGGDMNAYTTKEYTAFYVRVPAVDRALATDVLCDVIASPALRPLDVDSERDVILEELHLQLDEPDDLVHTELAAALFPGHPLGWEILGTQASITAMTPEAVRSFHDEWYRPANLVFAAAGPFDHEEVVASISAWFGGASAGPSPRRVAPGVPPERRRVVSRKVESVHVAAGWRAFGHHDPDRYALALCNQILGAGMSSRLFQEVREERGLAYSVFSSTATYEDAGVLSVYAGTSKARVREVLDVVRRQVESMATDGVTDTELRVAKGAFAGSTVINLEDTGNRMARLATGVTLRGTVTPIDTYLAAVAAVDHDDIRRVAARVLAAEPTLAAVGPVRERDITW
jgi:predicted Zn-dependent peptidase